MDSDQAEVPHIIDELAEWIISLNSKLSPDIDQNVALNLLRCRNSSLTAITATVSTDDNNDDVQSNQEQKFNRLSTLNWFVTNGWLKIRGLISNWFPPSPVIINYVHLRGRNCAWQLGYLSSGTVQGQALCLVATHWIELMELPDKLKGQTSSFLVQESKKNEDISPMELIDINTSSGPLELEKDGQIPLNQQTHKEIRKWYLNYIDPYPHWRFVCFLSTDKSNKSLDSNSLLDQNMLEFENLNYLVAIGYSNGSIDVIDLSINEDEKPDMNQPIKRSRIFISAPYNYSSTHEIHDGHILFPIVFLTFLNESHLIVGHFRGHLDLWHLDWEAKSFPARLMTRIYPCGNLCTKLIGHRSTQSFPLLAGNFDPSTNLLILANLPSNNQNSYSSQTIAKKFGLTCYYLSTKSPYLIPTETFDNNSSKNTSSLHNSLLNTLHNCKKLTGHLLSMLFRRGYQFSTYPNDATVTGTTNDANDAIAFISLTKCTGLSIGSITCPNPSNKECLIGNLHCSGSYSIWVVPSLEPLIIVANPLSYPSPSNGLTNIDSRPFRLSWWINKLDNSLLISKDSATVNSNNNSVQLAILHENGLMDVIDMKNTCTEFHSNIVKKMDNLHFSSYPVFATNSLIISQNNLDSNVYSNELILLYSYLKNNDTNFDRNEDKNSIEKLYNHCVRCTRIKATSLLDLFNHFLNENKFDEALKLAKQIKINPELVYKHMWLKKSSDSNEFKDYFKNLIEITLNQIKSHPFWVIKQCLDFLPTNMSSTVDYEQLICTLHSLHNHGLLVLKLLRLNKSLLTMNSYLDLIESRFNNQLLHLNCVEYIIQTESMHTVSSIKYALYNPEVRKPSIKDVIQTLQMFRYYSVLDIAVNYAYSQKFIALNILIKQFPQSVGLYCLAIASTISETIDPYLYAQQLLVMPRKSDLESTQSINQPEPNEKIINYLKFCLPPKINLSDLIKMENMTDVVRFIKLLIRWLIERAKQIDQRSGLTNHALNLLNIGLEVCQSLVENDDNHFTDVEMNLVQKHLNSLRKIRRHFIELAHIVYHRHMSPNSLVTLTTITKSNALNNQSINETISIAKFNISHYYSLNSKNILDLLLQVNLNILENDSFGSQPQTKINPDTIISFICFQLLPHLMGISHPNERQDLLNYCLLRVAIFSNGLSGHVRLMDLIRQGTIVDFIRDNLPIIDGVNKNLCIDTVQELETNLQILNIDKLFESLLYVVLNYEPRLQENLLDKGNLGFKPSLLYSTYLNDSDRLITSIWHCIKHAENIYAPWSKQEISLKEHQKQGRSGKRYATDRFSSKLLKDLQLVEKCVVALGELDDLLQSLQNHIGICTSTSNFNWIGALFKCSYEPGCFIKFLNYWMQVFGRLSVGLKNQQNSSSIPRDQKHNSLTKSSSSYFDDFLIKELNQTITQFYTIIKKLFSNYPAESWIHMGIQYALFASGDENFLELSRKFYLSIQNSQTYFENLTNKIESTQWKNWSLCLLNAVRTFVNTSSPSRSKFNQIFIHDNLNLMESNERLAYHCLEIVNKTFKELKHSLFDQNLFIEFQIEQYLLESSTYLTTLNNFLPKNTQFSIVTSPLKLRPYWILSSIECKNKRLNLLKESFIRLCQLVTNSLLSFSNISFLFELKNLEILSNSFMISISDVKKCFNQAIFDCLQLLNKQFKLPHREFLHLTLQYLKDLINSGSISGCWCECAQWTVDINLQENFSIPPNNNSHFKLWTNLHGLYHIESNVDMTIDLCEISPNSINSDWDLMLFWSVERYRLRLARYALAYCPNNYLYHMEYIVGVCITRLEYLSRLINTNNTNKQSKQNDLINFDNILSKKMFKHLFTTTNDADVSSVENNQNYEIVRKTLDFHLPSFYITDLNNSDIYSFSSQDHFEFLDNLNISSNEFDIWLKFLLNWCKYKSEEQIETNAQTIWARACFESLCHDTYLGLSYTSLPPFMIKKTRVNYESCVDFIQEINLLFLNVNMCNNESLPSKQINNAHRLKLLFICYTLWFISEQNKSTCNYYPSGSDLCNIIKSVCLESTQNENLQKISQILFEHCQLAIKELLDQRLFKQFPSIDFERFQTNSNYREDCLYGLCATHIGLGFRLCISYKLDQTEALFCRLEYLFNDEDLATFITQRQTEIKNLFHWIERFPNAFTLLLSRVQKTIYPFLQGIHKSRLFFDLFPIEKDSNLIDHLEISTHKLILNMMSRSEVLEKAFHSFSYTKFLSYLREPYDFHTHPLRKYINSEPLACAISQVVETIYATHPFESSIIRVGDVFAMYAFNEITNHESFNKFLDSSNISKVLENVAPENDPSSCSRILTWLDEVLYTTNADQLTIDQRCLLLKESELLANKRLQTSKNPHNWAEVVHQIRCSISQFERIIDKLSKIQFPQDDDNDPSESVLKYEPKINVNVQDSCLSQSFYNLFLKLKPNDHKKSYALLRKIVIAIINSDNDDEDLNNEETQSGSCPSGKLSGTTTVLKKIGDILPICLNVLQLDKEFSMNFVVESLTLYFTSIPTIFDVDMDSFIQPHDLSSTKSLFSKSQFDHFNEMFSGLFHLIQLFLSPSPKSVDFKSGNYLFTLDQFLPVLITNNLIRRSFGSKLILSLIDHYSTINLNGIYFLDVFINSIIVIKHLGSININLLSSTLEQLIDELNLIKNSSVTDITTDIIEKIMRSMKNMFDDAVLVSTNTIEDKSELNQLENYENIEIVADNLRTIIELFDLTMLYNLSELDRRNLLEELWILWLNYIWKTNLIMKLDDNFKLSQFLIYEWTKYNLPPKELALACLNILSTMKFDQNCNKLSNIKYNACLISICLLQSDIKIMEQILPILSKFQQSKQIITYIDSHVSCKFIFDHIQLWLDLIEINDQTVNCLFGHMFKCLRNFLQLSSKSIGCKRFIFYLIRLLSKKNLWFEAAKLCTVCDNINPINVPFDYLIKLVKDK